MLLLISCENPNTRSAVPHYPVQLQINTNTGIFVHFKPDNIGSYVIVDDEGYHYQGQTWPRTTADIYGYSGVIIYVTNNRDYAAFDRCCPHCLQRFIPVYIDGFFAVCPTCGEQYDLSYGYATPTKGISREALRRYEVFATSDRVTVRN